MSSHQIRHFPKEWVFAAEGLPLHVRAPYRQEQDAFPLHDHAFSELTIILEGTGRHQYGDESWQVRAGDVFVVHPGQIHGYEAAAGLQRQVLFFDPAYFISGATDIHRIPGFQALFNLEPNRLPHKRKKHGRLCLNPKDLGLVRDMCARIFEEQEQQSIGCDSMMRGLFYQLMVHLSRAYGHYADATGRQFMLCAQAQAWLQEHYSEAIRIDDLARAIDLSPTHLRRIFQSNHQQSPMAFLQQIRLTAAAQLLRDTDERITTIAFSVGFNDSNYFARAFRTMFAVSPRQWRQGHGG